MYKYIGIEESEGVQHQQIKDRLKKEYSRRLRMILKSELNARNKITSIGALAVPVLRHSCGIIKWRIEEIKKIDRKTRKMLTMYKMHHPKADTDRLYVKKKEGGTGMAQVEVVYKAEIINPLLSLTLQSAQNLNVPCWLKRSKALLLSSPKSSKLCDQNRSSLLPYMMTSLRKHVCKCINMIQGQTLK